ncbi:MAG TPA: MFS transporter, partial [Solirubrobacteraceae bacterium]
AAPFGALADRVSRKRMLVFADLLRAGAFLGLAVIPSYGGTVALALLAGVGTAMFRPTANAALPGMVTDEQRSAATALYGANFSIGMTVGPALTALVALFGPPSAMLAVNGATFIVSAVLLSSISFGAGARSPAASEPESERTTLWASTVDGARSVAQRPGVPILLVIGAAAILAGALMNVAEPMLATGPLRAGNSGYSLLVTAYGGAMAIGSLASARAGSSVAWLRRCFVIGLALQGVGMIASSLAPSLAWAIGELRADRSQQRTARGTGGASAAGARGRSPAGTDVRPATCWATSRTCSPSSARARCSAPSAYARCSPSAVRGSSRWRSSSRCASAPSDLPPVLVPSR